jgi:hypothetical protein
MFIQIAPRVKVFVSEEDMAFILKHRSESFRGGELPPEQQDRAKRLADKAIFVRKKLDTDVQYAINRKIKFLKQK